MNQTVIDFTRNEIKRGLGELTEKHHLRFKRMYSHNNLDKPINDVVDSIPEDKLGWALSQVENSLKKIIKPNDKEKLAMDKLGISIVDSVVQEGSKDEK